MLLKNVETVRKERPKPRRILTGKTEANEIICFCRSQYPQEHADKIGEHNFNLDTKLRPVIITDSI